MAHTGLADVIRCCIILVLVPYRISNSVHKYHTVFVLGSEIRLCLHGTVILLVTGVIYRSSYENEGVPKVT